MKVVTVNMGFVTNSSSCVHHFDRRVLDDPNVRAFMEAYNIQGGYVGSNLWNRSQCSSFIVTDAQRVEAQEDIAQVDFSPPSLTVHGQDTVAVIYGDEYSDITSELCNLLRETCVKLYPEWDHGHSEYN